MYFCFIDHAKGFDCVYHYKLQNILNEMKYQSTSPASWETCTQDNNQQLELDME